MSTLSRLESGRRRPTLALLIPLARAHRVALDQLVTAPATGDPRVHLKPRSRERGSVLVPLTQYPGRVQVFKQVLSHREPRLVTHAGYEWLYVLAGRLRLILGEREIVLQPGEVAEFDTGEPHWFGLVRSRRRRSGGNPAPVRPARRPGRRPHRPDGERRGAPPESDGTELTGLRDPRGR
ncbi:helix-turn-helix domain-containing protein [Streptomyces sp. NPDC002740]